MDLKIVLREIEAVKADFMDKKLNFEEVIVCFYQIEKNSNYCFTQIHNAFYSSTPAMYFE